MEKNIKIKKNTKIEKNLKKKQSKINLKILVFLVCA